MSSFENRGKSIRESAKSLVLDFMNSSVDCEAGISKGLKQAEIFKRCGLDFGDQQKARSTQQQYFVVAILRELENEGKVEQTMERGPWRLK